MAKELEMPKCCLCGREMAVDEFGGSYIVECTGGKRADADHTVSGPWRKTKRGAISAYNRMFGGGQR